LLISEDAIDSYKHNSPFATGDMRRVAGGPVFEQKEESSPYSTDERMENEDVFDGLFTLAD
jgi:hypothetical protein